MNTRKIMLLCLGLAFGCIPWVYAQNQVEVTIPTVTGEENSTVTIPIAVGDLTGRNVVAYQTVITFDESVLDATGASDTGTLSKSFGPPAVNTSIPGQITLGGFGTSPLSGSGTLVNLIFKVAGQPGEMTDLNFSNFVFNAGAPSANTRGGKFTVSLPLSVTLSSFSAKASPVRLKQNYPNPFNPETVIRYELANPEPTLTLVKVYSMRGALIRTLVNDSQPGGYHEVSWDGRNEKGEKVSSGLYFYQLISGKYREMRKMMKIK